MSRRVYLNFLETITITDKKGNEHNFYAKNLYEVKKEGEDCYFLSGLRNKKLNKKGKSLVPLSKKSKAFTIIVKNKSSHRRRIGQQKIDYEDYYEHGWGW